MDKGRGAIEAHRAVVAAAGVLKGAVLQDGAADVVAVPIEGGIGAGIAEVEVAPQSPLAGLGALEVKVMGSVEVPWAMSVLSIWMARPVLTFTVTPDSMVRVTPA